MKLTYKVAIRLSMAMIPLLALWTTVLYFMMVDEINVSAAAFKQEALLETMLVWILIIYAVILFTGIVVTMLIFKKLNEAAKDAAMRMENIYSQQKQFIGNVSHELQTPLAVLGNRMEWMLNNMEMPQEQMEEIIRMLQTQRQAVRLNKDLLLLIKIDNMQFKDEVQLDLVPVISDSVEMYGEIFEDKQMECTLDLPDNFIVTINTTLASVLITNLVRNAYIHSDANTHIKIKLSDGVLAVMNSGDAPLDDKLIFERFYKGVKKEGSTGLGLPLVKAICDNYNLQIEYSFKERDHIFSVKW